MEYHPGVRASDWLKPAAIGKRVASPIDAFARPPWCRERRWSVGSPRSGEDIVDAPTQNRTIGAKNPTARQRLVNAGRRWPAASP